MVRTAGQQFVDNYVVHYDNAWSGHPIPAEQVDVMYVQLRLLHMHIRWVIDPGLERDVGKKGVIPSDKSNCCWLWG